MGWDDNGLPTERRVQNYFGVRCDPSLPYDPDFTPAEKPGKDQTAISRRNFIELCEQLTVEDEKAFEDLWRQLGLSVDWSNTYQTIDTNARATSQKAFLRNLARDEAYQAEAPTLWDVTFRTAVAQAELEDRERPGAYHRIGFTRHDDGEPIYIETTRPELLAACVALVAHPDDERYQPLFGTTVTSPVFKVEVPVVAHHLADPEKGSGIAMICTFGDLTDVVWWRELNLPTRPILGWDGRIIRETPAWIVNDPRGRRTSSSRARRCSPPKNGWSGCSLNPAGSHSCCIFWNRSQREITLWTSTGVIVLTGGRAVLILSDRLKHARRVPKLFGYGVSVADEGDVIPVNICCYAPVANQGLGADFQEIFHTELAVEEAFAVVWRHDKDPASTHNQPLTPKLPIRREIASDSDVDVRAVQMRAERVRMLLGGSCMHVWVFPCPLQRRYNIARKKPFVRRLSPECEHRYLWATSPVSCADMRCWRAPVLLGRAGPPSYL